MLKAKAYQHILDFKLASGTSRGVLKQKETWFVKIWDTNNSNIFGLGECGILRSLSYDDTPQYIQKINEVCQNIATYSKNYHQSLIEFPSIRFGVEMALLDLKNKARQTFFESSFTKKEKGIPINGLIWMGDEGFMKKQIKEKIEVGFDCIKMKIGAINFETELKLLRAIRKQFSKNQIEIRVDANGAFSPKEAITKLEALAKLDIHSIEQPIKAGQINAMSNLCSKTPLSIALDEELIGVHLLEDKLNLLKEIKPQYIILKPSLIGGFQASEEWVSIAEKKAIDWWATSALESNIGLNAIAQWTAKMNTTRHQGLGTGGLYTNNIDAPLEIRKGKLWMNDSNFDFSLFQ